MIERLGPFLVFPGVLRGMKSEWYIWSIEVKTSIVTPWKLTPLLVAS